LFKGYFADGALDRCAAAAGCPTRVLERTEIVRYMINEFDRCPMRLVFRCGRRLVRHTPQQRDERCRDPLVAPSTPAIGASASVRSRADAAGRCVSTQRLRHWRRQGVGKPKDFIDIECLPPILKHWDVLIGRDPVRWTT